MLSCSQACMVRLRGTPAATCSAHCSAQAGSSPGAGGCQRTINGHSYSMCQTCTDLDSTCPHGVQSALPCKDGCAANTSEVLISFPLSSKHSSHHSGEGFSNHLWIYKDDSVLGGVCQAGDCLVGRSFYLSRRDGSDSSGPYSMSHTNPADGRDVNNNRALYIIASGERFSAPSGAAYAIGDLLSFTAPTVVSGGPTVSQPVI